jgi:hypothetical protein
MVWTTQLQLREACLRGPAAEGSLYSKAAAAGIPSNEMDPEFPGYLSNKDFLAQLIAKDQLTESAADELQKTVAAGYPLDSDEHRQATLWKNLQTALFFSSLPETYAYSDIAERLVKSGQLSTNLQTAGERIKQTGKATTAIVQGMADGDGTGLHRAFLLGARHTRLAAVRGEAGLILINQASMAFTLLTFSVTPFAAIARAQVDAPSSEHQLSWLKMWNAIGSLMGIADDGLPSTIEQAQALDALFRESPQFKRTADGEQLITVLVQLGQNRTAVFYGWAGAPVMELLGVQLPRQ